jgi:Protein of unknown function (DUF2569)
MFDEPEQPNVRRISVLFLFLPLYFNSFANSGEQAAPGVYFNWITIWLSFFFGLLFTILFRFLNKYSKTIDQRSDAGLPLSGWIMFLGINLIVRIIIQAYFFWNANYFLKSTWLNLQQLGGVNFQLLFIFELFLSLFALAGTGALIYWFFGRRDIFPTMFIYYASFYLVATSVLLIIYHFIDLPAEMISIRRDMYIQFFRIVYTTGLMIFVWKSDRVKQTFVYPPG